MRGRPYLDTIYVDHVNLIIQFLSIWWSDLKTGITVATVRIWRSFLWCVMNDMIHVIQWQNVTDGATVTKWAINFKSRFCNALAVEHKYNDSLPINEAHNYKRKAKEVKGTHKYSTKHHSPVCFSLKSFSLIDLSIGGGLANATLACYSSTKFIL